MSVEQPTISASSNCLTEEKYQHLQQSSNYVQAFQSAGFGGPEQQTRHQLESQYRLSDYEAPVTDYNE